MTDLPQGESSNAGIFPIIGDLLSAGPYLRKAELTTLKVGTTFGVGIALGALPLLLNRDPWGTEGDPQMAGMESALSIAGAGGNATTASIAATYGAGAASATVIGLAAAAIGGYELGRGFNQAWNYFSDGQSSFGTWQYDVSHRQ